MAEKRTGVVQALLPFRQHGGARVGAGCKKKRGSGVSHCLRGRVAKGCPVHVTVSLGEGFADMRQEEEYRVLRECFRAGRDRMGFRLVHYSVQGNHLHLIVEVQDRRALSRGMQGLLIRIARGLNRLWGHAGSIFGDRYHAHVLKTPREVRNALMYVLNNAQKHGRGRRGRMDYFCSGWWFDGWKENPRFKGLEKFATPICKAHSWLLARGWRRHRLISLQELPGSS